MVTGSSKVSNKANSLTGYQLYDEQIIAFHARLSTHSYVLNRQTIVFDNALVNKGNFYIPYLGVFMCPDDAVYLFAWSVRLESEGSSKRAPVVQLMMAGEVAKSGPKGQKISSHFSSSSTQAIVQCEEEKGIYLQAVTSPANSPLYFHYSFCSFIGFRLPRI